MQYTRYHKRRPAVYYILAGQCGVTGYYEVRQRERIISDAAYLASIDFCFMLYSIPILRTRLTSRSRHNYTFCSSASARPQTKAKHTDAAVMANPATSTCNQGGNLHDPAGTLRAASTAQEAHQRPLSNARPNFRACVACRQIKVRS